MFEIIQFKVHKLFNNFALKFSQKPRNADSLRVSCSAKNEAGSRQGLQVVPDVEEG